MPSFSVSSLPSLLPGKTVSEAGSVLQSFYVPKALVDSNSKVIFVDLTLLTLYNKHNRERKLG